MAWAPPVQPFSQPGTPGGLDHDTDAGQDEFDEKGRLHVQAPGAAGASSRGEASGERPWRDSWTREIVLLLAGGFLN